MCCLWVGLGVAGVSTGTVIYPPSHLGVLVARVARAERAINIRVFGLQIKLSFFLNLKTFVFDHTNATSVKIRKLRVWPRFL